MYYFHEKGSHAGFFWDSGELFLGEIRGKLPFGRGIIILPEKGIFYGDFVNGELNGKGVYLTQSGSLCLSAFLKNFPSGDPIFLDPKTQSSSDIFGSFQGTISEEFPLTFSDILEEIESKCGNKKKEGLGVLNISNNLEYFGYRERGEAEGLGVFWEGGRVLCLGRFEVISLIFQMKSFSKERSLEWNGKGIRIPFGVLRWAVCFRQPFWHRGLLQF